MIVFRVNKKMPILGDILKYNNKCYQLITEPKICKEMQGGLLVATARHTCGGHWHEKTFFFTKG